MSKITTPVPRSPSSSPPTPLEFIFSLMPPLVTASEFERAGGDFGDCQLHVTSTFDDRDREGLHATIVALTQYGSQAKAYHLMRSPFGGYSLQILFSDDEVGNNAVRLWNKTVNAPLPREKKDRRR